MSEVLRLITIGLVRSVGLADTSAVNKIFTSLDKGKTRYYNGWSHQRRARPIWYELSVVCPKYNGFFRILQ